MLVFIDESGDAGFKLSSGSSPLFVVGMVVFKTDLAAQQAVARIEGIAQRVGHKSEFKFSSCRNDVRDVFFREMAKEDFEVRALIVEKSTAPMTNRRALADQFYRRFIQLLLRQQDEFLQDAKIVLDGKGSRDFKSALQSEIRGLMPAGAVASLRLKDSKSDRLVQLADMCVGAIYRSHRCDKKQETKWFENIRPRIVKLHKF